MTQAIPPQNNILATAPIGPLLAKFALPGMVAMLVNALYNIVDQVFIGWGVGYLGNGAANVVLLITLCSLALSLWLGDGAAASLSLSLGAGDRDKAAQSAGNAIAALAVVGLLVLGAGQLWLEPILRMFGCTDVLLPHAMAYGRIIVAGLPFILVGTGINALIRADGSPKYAMTAMISGAALNVCLDALFIFGFGWGMRGAALATLLGQLLSFALSVAYLRKFRHITLNRAAFRPRLATLRRIAGLGISSFIDQAAFTLVMAVNNNLIVHYGALSEFGREIPLTAYGISMKVQEILFTLLLGLSLGMQPIVGFNYGAGRFDRVKKAYALAVGVGTALSLGATALFVLAPGPIIRLFGAADNALYFAFSRQFFQTYFLLYVFFGFQTVTGVFFQAIGKPAKAAILSLSYQLAFKIAAAVGLSASLGLDGVLWSGPAADGLTFFLALALAAGEWRRLGKNNPSAR